MSVQTHLFIALPLMSTEFSHEGLGDNNSNTGDNHRQIPVVGLLLLSE
jgi:hypothetical protein